MLDEHVTHLFTGTGSLCGTKGSFHWSLIESAVSCPTCRALLEMQRTERRHAQRGAVPLAKVLHLE